MMTGAPPRTAVDRLRAARPRDRRQCRCCRPGVHPAPRTIRPIHRHAQHAQAAAPDAPSLFGEHDVPPAAKPARAAAKAAGSDTPGVYEPVSDPSLPKDERLAATARLPGASALRASAPTGRARTTSTSFSAWATSTRK